MIDRIACHLADTLVIDQNALLIYILAYAVLAKAAELKPPPLISQLLI